METQIQIINKEYVTPNGGLLVIDFIVTHNDITFQFREGLVMSEHLEEEFTPFMNVPDSTIIEILLREKDFANCQIFGAQTK